MLVPYGSQPECCGDKTKHHAVPDHCFKGPGEEGYYQGIRHELWQGFVHLCLRRRQNEKRKQHARIHRAFDKVEDDNYPWWTFGAAKKQAAKACSKVTGCKKSCMEQRLSQHYDQRVSMTTQCCAPIPEAIEPRLIPLVSGPVMTPGVTFP